MTDISFLKAVIKQGLDEKHKKWHTSNLGQNHPIKTSQWMNEMQLVVPMWSDKASNQSQVVCDLPCGFN